MFYTALEALCKLYDEGTQEYAFAAADTKEHALWRQAARARLWEITGLRLCRPAPLRPELVGTEELAGAVREYRTIQTEPGIFLPFWLHRPARPNGACLLVLHGHGGGKEGNLRLQTNGRPYLELLLEEGYLVVCPDARGSGDRQEFVQQQDPQAGPTSHRELQNIALGFGGSVVGMYVWDLMRLLDYLLEAEEIEDGRIGCTGMSGGGQQTLWLAALDDRVRAAVTSGYFYGMKESLLKLPHNCSCNFVPHMWNTMDMGDLGALIAPRPFLVESGRHDHLNGAPGLDNVYPQVEITARAFGLYGAQERLTHSVHEGKHEWNGHEVIPFLNRWLLGATP